MGISNFVSSITKPSSELTIELEEPARAGQELRGVVTLTIAEEELSATSLELSIGGKEKVAVHYTTQNENQTQHHHERAEHEFFMEEIELAHFDESIARGENKYRFSVKLPPNLPAAFDIPHTYNTSGCSIDYEVNARLRRPGKLSRDARASAEFLPTGGKPVSRAAAEGQSLEFGPTTVPIKMCGCFSRGTMSIGALASSLTFTPGDTATIKVASRNDSRSNCSKVIVRHQLEANLQASRRRGSAKRTFDSQEMDGSTMGLGRSLMNDGNFVRASEAAADDIRNRLRSSRNSAHEFTIPIDKDASTSYEGHLINVSHFLRIVMKTPFGQTEPKLALPITVTDDTHHEVVTGVPVDSSAAAVTDAASIVYGAVVQPELPEQSATAQSDAATGTAGLEPLIKALAYSASPERDVNTFNAQHPNTLATLTPEEFAMVCTSCSMLDQAKAAGAVAGYMSSGPTCSHIAELVKKASSLVKVDIVKLLAPSCTNLEEGKQLILEELNEFEGMQCRSCLNFQ